MNEDALATIEGDWDGSPAGGLTDLALAAAAYELAMLSGDGGRTMHVVPLPVTLRDAIARDAFAQLPPRVSAAEAAGRESRAGAARPTVSVTKTLGVPWQWLVALAGCGVIAGLGYVLVSHFVLPLWSETAVIQRNAPDPAEKRRERLLAEDADVIAVDWAAGKDPAVARLPAGMTHGDVVWSQSRQQGYMRIRGLAANDPAVEQYRVWIFDAERGAAHPVDGGVFNVPACDADGEVCVPIEARLPIGTPTLFAISVEKPGGATVSSRERLPLLAKVPRR
jgi:hypothetical protein